MNAYIARQPIYDVDRKVAGYELLYRDAEGATAFSGSVDGTHATNTVLSDALTSFGIEALTNGHPAFINFTRALLMSEIDTVMSPDDFVVEILEDVHVDEALVQRVQDWYARGYRFALDDYTGDTAFDPLLPYAEFIKVDFRLLTLQQTKQLAGRLRGKRKKLLAEKVETEREFEAARQAGYTMFQGYYFEKPTTLVKKLPEVQKSTCLRLFNATQEKEINFSKLAGVVQTDVGLVYRLLQHVNRMGYYRGHAIGDARQALVLLGAVQTRKWATLVFLRDFAADQNPEITKSALIRATLAEKVALKMGRTGKSANAYLVGIFSILDDMLEGALPEIVDSLCVEPAVKDALLAKPGVLRDILLLVYAYEAADWSAAEPLLQRCGIHEDLTQEYVEAVRYADEFFGAL